MTLELERTFNREVERFRRSLLLYAGQCDWEAFKENAGTLFEYLESIEIAEVEKRFFSVFRIILFLLFIAVIVITKIDLNTYPQLERFKETITILAAGGCCYGLYFFLSFRKYVILKSVWRKMRKQRFIRDIENDFKNNNISTA